MGQWTAVEMRWMWWSSEVYDIDVVAGRRNRERGENAGMVSLASVSDYDNCSTTDR